MNMLEMMAKTGALGPMLAAIGMTPERVEAELASFKEMAVNVRDRFAAIDARLARIEVALHVENLPIVATVEEPSHG